MSSNEKLNSTNLNLDQLVAASHVDASEADSTDERFIKQLIEAKAWKQLVHHCQLLSEDNRDWIGALVDEKIAKRLKFKSDKLSDKIRADLVGWGYDDIRLNQLDDTIEIAGERLTDHIEADIEVKARDAGYGGRAKPLAAIESVIKVISTESAYHPIRDFLSSLEWDGENHIGKLAQYVTDNHELITYISGNKCSVFQSFFHRWMIDAGCAGHARRDEVEMG